MRPRRLAGAPGSGGAQCPLLRPGCRRPHPGGSPSWYSQYWVPVPGTPAAAAPSRSAAGPLEAGSMGLSIPAQTPGPAPQGSGPRAGPGGRARQRVCEAPLTNSLLPLRCRFDFLTNTLLPEPLGLAQMTSLEKMRRRNRVVGSSR